jgi:sulfate transport system ATP-binding protein
MSIEVRGLWKSFDGHPVLRDVSLQIPDGELVALLGPSGCGKTTLLRIIAGLEGPDAGAVHHGGEEITAKSPRERNVGVVFQHYALFRHMTVAENVAFSLRVRKRPAAEVQARVDELLGLVQLAGFKGRYPHQLSGGQRQRVALARALATQPRILLLDEPFGALDARVRADLRRWLRRLHDELHVTSVFVTHDQEEAFEVSDRVVLMNAGQIEQVGSPAQVFEEPRTPFVMRFLGAVNVFQGHVDGEHAWLHGQAFLAPRAGAQAAGATSAPAHPAKVYVRPHELDVHRTPVPGSFAARVERLVPLGAAVRVELLDVREGRPVEVELDQRQHAALALSPGDAVHLSPQRVRVFPLGAEAQDSLTASSL